MRRSWFASIVCVIGLGLIIQANIAHAKLVDILYEKGQITKEEWVKAKADEEREEAIIQQRPTTERWYEKLSIRGYTQLRYNAVTDNKKLNSPYDSSIGNNKGFIFRRARLVLSGDVNEWVSLYFQTDFAASAGTGNNNFAQLRDLCRYFPAYVVYYVQRDEQGSPYSSGPIEGPVWVRKSSVQPTASRA